VEVLKNFISFTCPGFGKKADAHQEEAIIESEKDKELREKKALSRKKGFLRHEQKAHRRRKKKNEGAKVSGRGPSVDLSHVEKSAQKARSRLVVKGSKAFL